MPRKKQIDSSPADENIESDESAAPDEVAPEPPQPAESEVVLDPPEAEAEAPVDIPAAVEESPPPPPPVAPPAPARRGGFWPLALGGAVAAGLGFAGAATVFAPSQPIPPDRSEELAALTAEVKGMNERIAALRGDLEALRSDPRIADLAAMQAETPGLIETAIADAAAPMTARVDAALKSVGDMDARVVALEKRPIASGAASATALDAISREMDELRAEIAANRDAAAAVEAQIADAAAQAASRIAAAEAQTEELKAEAEAAARATTMRASLSRLYAAFDAGSSLETSLAELAAAGLTVPAELTEAANAVPSLASLRAGFAGAARNALAATLKPAEADTTWDKVVTFMRSQSGARSLSPRAGDDPDAILSRAEAALGTGDLASALSELQALPDPGKDAMGEWITLATRRVAAKDAIAALAQQVN
ncbi:MAG: hypothetical protein KDE08_14800 [Rhodobacteraceae bacterium]|nr:hypothetical protein [Paracoccaceae bacterium]